MLEGLAVWALFIYLLRLIGMPWNKDTKAFAYLGGTSWLLFVWVGFGQLYSDGSVWRVGCSVSAYSAASRLNFGDRQNHQGLHQSKPRCDER